MKCNLSLLFCLCEHFFFFTPFFCNFWPPCLLSGAVAHHAGGRDSNPSSKSLVCIRPLRRPEQLKRKLLFLIIIGCTRRIWQIIHFSQSRFHLTPVNPKLDKCVQAWQLVGTFPPYVEDLWVVDGGWLGQRNQQQQPSLMTSPQLFAGVCTSHCIFFKMKIIMLSQKKNLVNLNCS